MNLQALYHKPKSSYAFAKSLHELQLRLRTAKDDAKEVKLFFGMKFAWDNKKSVPMEKKYSDDLFDYYQYNLKTEDVRLGYYFEIISGEKRLYYTEAGILQEFDDTIAHQLFFQYPAVHSVDLWKEPSWLKDAIFYQIFVERFDNGKKEISPEHLVPWDSEPTPGSFYGGDLIGITNRIDYLVDLGVNALYLTPVFESVSNHKYDTIDYFEIDRHFGTKEDFKRLVDTAHGKGIRIVLDAVFNHCSSRSAYFQDVVKNGEQSAYKDWFLIKSFPVSTNPLSYEVFATVDYMPRFNTSNPEVKEFLYSVMEYWTKEFGVDGWRLDVSDEPDHWFWRDFRRRLKEFNEEKLILGENWHDATPWLMGDQFDTVMNYPVANLAINYIAKETINAEEFTNRLIRHYMLYAEPVSGSMFNLLDSHDTERFLYLCEEEKDKLKMAAAFLFGYAGIPCTYYGTEIGMTGGYDPGCRKGFCWEKEAWDVDLRDYYKRLIAIRKEEEALKSGELEFLSEKDIFILRRHKKDSSIFIVINATKEEKKIPEMLVKECQEELISGKRMKDGRIPPRTAYYLR